MLVWMDHARQLGRAHRGALDAVGVDLAGRGTVDALLPFAEAVRVAAPSPAVAVVPKQSTTPSPLSNPPREKRRSFFDLAV